MYLDKSYILAEIKDCLADEIISWCYDNIDNSYLYEEEPYYGIVHDVLQGEDIKMRQYTQ